MEVAIRVTKSHDWVEVDIDGRPFLRGHSIGLKNVVSLLKELGHQVNFQEAKEDD